LFLLYHFYYPHLTPPFIGKYFFDVIRNVRSQIMYSFPNGSNRICTVLIVKWMHIEVKMRKSISIIKCTSGTHVISKIISLPKHIAGCTEIKNR
jgi:hypothetical protein